MRILAAVVLAALGTASCDDDAPINPTPAAVNLTGTWTGSIAVVGTNAVMTWQLAQTGAAVSGPVRVLLPTGTVLLNGTLTGTISGSTLPYTIAVPPGGLPSEPACSGQISGTTTIVNASTMNGSYSVTSSNCNSGITTGTFTLTK